MSTGRTVGNLDWEIIGTILAYSFHSLATSGLEPGPLSCTAMLMHRRFLKRMSERPRLDCSPTLESCQDNLTLSR